MVNLEKYINEDKLVPTKYLQWKDDYLYLVGCQERVYIEPRASGVVNYLRTHQNLWEVAQIGVHSRPFDLKGVAIFGVPFNVALDLLSKPCPSELIIKSMFQRADRKSLSDSKLGFVATLVAHLSRPRTSDDVLISLEAWEILNADTETFYIHGLFSLNKGYFIHLDGATMYHSFPEKCCLFRKGAKAKGANYKKHFRLDGVLDINTVRDVVMAFLPLEDLTTEYILTHQRVDDV